MVATPSWPGLSRPSLSPPAGKEARDKPGHDERATSSSILTPMRTSPAMTQEQQPLPFSAIAMAALPAGQFRANGDLLLIIARNIGITGKTLCKHVKRELNNS